MPEILEIINYRILYYQTECQSRITYANHYLSSLKRETNVTHECTERFKTNLKLSKSNNSLIEVNLLPYMLHSGEQPTAKECFSLMQFYKSDLRVARRTVLNLTVSAPPMMQLRLWRRYCLALIEVLCREFYSLEQRKKRSYIEVLDNLSRRMETEHSNFLAALKCCGVQDKLSLVRDAAESHDTAKLFAAMEEEREAAAQIHRLELALSDMSGYLTSCVTENENGSYELGRQILDYLNVMTLPDDKLLMAWRESFIQKMRRALHSRTAMRELDEVRV